MPEFCSNFMPDESADRVSVSTAEGWRWSSILFLYTFGFFSPLLNSLDRISRNKCGTNHEAFQSLHISKLRLAGRASREFPSRLPRPDFFFPWKVMLSGAFGRMQSGPTLLLGPPQSGKSSLMKAIAGRLQEGRHGRLQGTPQVCDLLGH